MTFDHDVIMEIILALGGLGLFLYGMRLMGEGLELAAGSNLRNLLEKLTTNRFLGALVGVVVTGIIQSSTAVSVMCVGFVNAAIMNLSQAMGVIMGATIGTTVTSVLLSIQISDYAPIAIFLGAIMVMISKKNNHKYIGQIIAGFGILFFGMTTMSANLKPIAQSEFFSSIITSVSNPIVGVLFGIAFAAILQSSSAAVGVLQALGAAGALLLPNAVYMVYGIHIGACVTAVISAIGATKAAKRTALCYVLFTVTGTLIFVLISMFTPFHAWVESVTDNVTFQISLVHIISSIVATLLLLPGIDLIIKFSEFVIPGKEDNEVEQSRLKYVDERLLSTPPFAVSQVTKEIDRMGKLARKNFEKSMLAFVNKDEAMIKEVEENEEVIDYLNMAITSFLVKLNGLNLEDSDRVKIGSYYHVVSDMERIGDHAENICELAGMLISKNESFSEDAAKEIEIMNKLVMSIIDDSLKMFESSHFDQKMVDLVSNIEQEIDDKTAIYKDRHIQRLSDGTCNATVGTLFMELLTNLERIADHSTNIAFSMYPHQEVTSKEAVG